MVIGFHWHNQILGVPKYKQVTLNVKNLKITIPTEGTYAYMIFLANTVGKTSLMHVILRNWGDSLHCHGFTSGDFKIYYTSTTGVYYLKLDDGGQYGFIHYALNTGAKNTQIEEVSEIPSGCTEMDIS